MRVLQLNTFYGFGSTGRVTYDLKQVMEDVGIESYVAFGFGYEPKLDEVSTVYRIETDRELFISKLWTKITGHHGFNNKKETRKLLTWIDKVKPDIIHMHNIHNHYVNIRLLLEYIAVRQIPCILTMHDCWTFTGHCAHFDQFGCDKWKIECKNCRFLNTYPQSWFVDRSQRNYNLKKRLLTSIGDHLTLVPVSYWLEGLLKQSFLKNMNIQTIHNGIDLDVFRYCTEQRDAIRRELGVGIDSKLIGHIGRFDEQKNHMFLLEIFFKIQNDFG